MKEIKAARFALRKGYGTNCWLLDTTFIRIGNETSRDDKEKATYGLSTMQDEHIDFEPTEITDEHDKWYDSQVGGSLLLLEKVTKNRNRNQ